MNRHHDAPWERIVVDAATQTSHVLAHALCILASTYRAQRDTPVQLDDLATALDVKPERARQILADLADATDYVDRQAALSEKGRAHVVYVWRAGHLTGITEGLDG